MHWVPLLSVEVEVDVDNCWPPEDDDDDEEEEEDEPEVNTL